MRVTFATELGNTYSIEIDPNMELENIMALLEAESGVPTSEQSISYDGRELTNGKSTMAEYGVQDDAVLLFRKKVHVGERTFIQDAEMIRLQLLSDAGLMSQLRERQPEMAEAAESNPRRFAELLSQARDRQAEVEHADRIDPLDVDGQKRIEEAIRQQAVMENLEHALEYAPEAFGRVTMLYVPVEVNGHPVKAFVDSGAQQTIMSPSCAEACGLMRLLDTRFSGIARGVGTAKILGRVHMAQLKLADLHLPCSFTIMEGRDVDLLFGLDMLKAHQACIDLEKSVLRIQGREVSFLAEHELPDQARMFESGNNEEEQAQSGGAQAGSSSTPQPQPQQQQFPGAGQTLGSTPPQGRGTPNAGTAPARSRHPEEHIQMLIDLGGVPREAAIRMLDAARGNIDVAASMLFQ